MRPRHGIVELFSTFLQLEADRFQTWITDARLRRNIERSLQQIATDRAPVQDQAQVQDHSPSQATQLSENFWALHWHKLWQTNGTPIARSHLIAYVQEPCYWVAQKTATNFAGTQHTTADCFQMAIGQMDKVLKGFDAQQGYNFKNYAAATLGSLIRETLRQRQELDICTDWGLLRKTSQKRLVEALQNAGHASDTIDRYVLAWTCFNTIYTPKQPSGTRKLPKPDAAMLEAIVQLYQQESQSFLKNQPTKNQPAKNQPKALTPDHLEKSLTACAKAIRAYLYPNLVSINAPKPGFDSGEFLDDLTETTYTTSLLADLITAEETATRQTQHTELSQVLTQTIAQLDDQSRCLIEFYYRDGLTQQQMADRLTIKQYTISRRLTKARETLLFALAQWSQTTLHIPPNPDLLKHTSTALEEWLKTHYHHPDLSPNS